VTKIINVKINQRNLNKLKRSKQNNRQKEPQEQLNITSIVLRTAFLDGSIYKSITGQPKILLLAFILVCITGIGFGYGLNNQPFDATTPDVLSFMGDERFAIVTRMGAIILSWNIWAILAWLSTKWAFKGKGSIIDMFRSIGIAYAPGILFFGGQIGVPALNGTWGEGLLMFAKLWVFAVGVQAVKETAGFRKMYGYIPGILTGIICWFLFFVVVP
tara:strand:- start:45092 stop:45739 length:648 start_codon:yes stop_codon:yes gene_type:complete